MADWDYIIVGAGSAGCVLANRLSADPSCRVLLLEAGRKDDSFWIPIPVGFLKLISDKTYNWCFATEPEDNVAGRSIQIPRGKTLGGSSSINGMIYVRGQPLDFDTWSQLGCRGWSYESVLPYFRRSENYAGGGNEIRGSGGPLDVLEVPERHAILDAFIDAAVEAGYPRNPDYNSGDQEGVAYYQVTQRRGRRWSTARAFLDTARKRPNLRVETEAQTTRVLLEGRRAVGIEYVQGGQTKTARAAREVVLAAGAVQSPQLLELSGIGRPDVLGGFGIAVRHELPGVGENYRDHFAPRMNWRVKLPVTLNEQTRGLSFLRELAKYYTTGRGILTLPAGIVAGFVKTRPEVEGPDVQYHFAHASYASAAVRTLDREPGMTITVCQLRPESKGSIHVKSADPLAPPAIRPNFLAEAVDRQCVVDGMKIARRIVEQPAMDRYRAFEMTPGPSVQSDEEWLQFARANGQTVYHPIGTCKMGHDRMAVVDDRLRVHGIAGLRVVDASIMPTLVSGNTNAPTIMIGEKGADMILEDAKARVAA
ncbi:choline dehydrogenase-like flavoprotein [Stella humosa]|uniref:Choline dehydrogenase-like flavoprotein n=1 Tax=Stella humosa TaxID=94 RepID=A0A3N1KVJ2_9PROT|nr:choline dehydrogenase [Stella humosa]ROP83974.1 choline dehydrogenase-like flavoprotein [Stella humosa]BBK33482.1 choline dehydrogenase [Stella humosa]